MISGIGWVSELVDVYGGVDVFPEPPRRDAAKDRIVRPEQVINARPDIVIGSWCSKKSRYEIFAARPGFGGCPRCGADFFGK